MDQFLTYKKGNLGPIFNSTAYMLYIIYIYIYIYKRTDASPIGRAPFLRTHFPPVFSKKMQKCSSNISDEHSRFIDRYSFSFLSSSPVFRLSLCFFDILKPQLCPNGEASGYVAEYIYIYIYRRVISLSTFWPF